MIEKMKKLTFLVYHREYDEFLHRLQELGVMHVEGGALEEGQSDTVSADMAELRRVDNLLQQLQNLPAAKESTPATPAFPSAAAATPASSFAAPATPASPSAAAATPASFPAAVATPASPTAGECLVPGDCVAKGESLLALLADLSAREKELTEQVEALTPWGEFDPAYVREQMSAAGCEMHFFKAATKVFNKEIAPNFPVEAVSEKKGTTFFVAIMRRAETSTVPEGSPEGRLSQLATEATPPAAQLSTLRIEQEQTRVQYAETLSQLRTFSDTQTAALQDLRSSLASRLDFDTVRATTETAAEDSLMVLRGWIPAKREAEVQNAFADSGAWFEVSNPQPGDDIPVCLRNNRFFKLFEMFTELYMLPKYNELDLTPYLAPFYILFFGLCLGDSGYGLFITLGVLAVKFFKKDLSQSMKAAMNLLLILGISAFFCGLLSGAFFGFNLYTLGVPFLDNLGNAVSLDNSQMFNLSLILGFIQIIFGMCLKAYNRTIQLGFAYSLSTIGWMMVIISLAVTLLMPAYSATAKWFTYAGLALAFLMNSPERYQKNPATGLLINVGSGLWDAYNTATGMLGDMLSYVRLFALGLSGGILATVFDSLATGLAPDHVVLGPIVMILIFVFGHALNMFMNVLGAFVHPMRLTFVEFFKNAGYEGGGSAYRPFGK
ncbi:MAG: V-type ATP synthase subunit I [Bacteroidaceae bacterium]|nr:V-type ATP synthase subunit I [Bacteroidaceae bacterium]